MPISLTPIYEKSFDNSICHFYTIGLVEYNNANYIYSGITLVLNFTGFTQHFDTIDHAYSNVILNNDVYIYTGLTNEVHYFRINDFYSGSTSSIDVRLTGMTESEIISGFSTSIISCTNQLVFSGNCCPTQVVKSNSPWVYYTNEGGGADNCSPFINRRPEQGWTIDFVFNKNNLPWANSVFFYMGVRDEYDPSNYGDNNLSFSFTSDGRIKWQSYRYSGYCNTITGYTEMYYIDSGQTLPLCPNGTTNDFNITMSFERYYTYTDCEILNEGGWNDLIHTGITSSSGSTIVPDTKVEQLSYNWLRERNKRLGTLKIYHNGRPMEIDDTHSSIPNFRNVPVYKFKNWEEIVLSDRGFQPFINTVGGGVSGIGNLHNSTCCYIIKNVAYFDGVIKFSDIRNRYISTIKTQFNITECWEGCVDDIY